MLVDHVDGAVKSRPTADDLARRPVSRRRCSSARPPRREAAGALAKYGAEKVYVADDADMKGSSSRRRPSRCSSSSRGFSGGGAHTSSPEGKEIAARLAIKTVPGLTTDDRRPGEGR